MTEQASVIADLATSLGLESLQPDEAGLYTLVVDGGLPVFLRFTPDADGLVLFAGLGALPADKAGAAARALLEANHFWTETGGFTLCLIPGTLNLMLVGRERTAALAKEGLFDLFDRFVSAATVWRHRLPTIADDSPSAAVETMIDAVDANGSGSASSTMPFPGSFA